MNLVDKLLKIDSKKADELRTGTFESQKLASIVGEKNSVKITIKELPSRRLNDIMTYQIDKKGNIDYDKSYDAKLMMCVEGIVEPDLRDKDLQAHFVVKSATQLAEKLFGFEINTISDAITKLSGINTDEDTETEIKN